MYGRAATAEEVTLKGLAPCGYSARSEFRPGLDLAAAALAGVRPGVLQPGLGAAISGQVFQNRAIRPLISVATVDKGCECLCIACMASMRRRKSSARACAMRLTLALVRLAAVLPQAHQLGNLCHREAEIPRALDELQCVDVALAVLPISVIAAGDTGD